MVWPGDILLLDDQGWRLFLVDGPCPLDTYRRHCGEVHLWPQSPLAQREQCLLHVAPCKPQGHGEASSWSHAHAIGIRKTFDTCPMQMNWEDKHASYVSREVEHIMSSSVVCKSSCPLSWLYRGQKFDPDGYLQVIIGIVIGS